MDENTIIYLVGYQTQENERGFSWRLDKRAAEIERSILAARGYFVTELRVIKLAMLRLPENRRDHESVDMALRDWPEAWGIERLAEERMVRESLHDDPFVSNEDYGRLVEEAIEADEQRSLRFEAEESRRP